MPKNTMKKLLILTAFISYSLLSYSQNRKLPKVDLKTIDNNTFNTSDFDNDGQPIVISFWATWCKPCIKELNNIAEFYEDWQDETGVKVIAISIDDARNMSKVKPKVNALLWDYEVYCDPNGDLKRAMGVGSVPHTFYLMKIKKSFINTLAIKTVTNTIYSKK